MSWTAKQSCPSCTWQGYTPHQLYALTAIFSYLVAVAIVAICSVDLFPNNGNNFGTWVIVIAANVWFYALPGWLLRRNTCPSCKRKFSLDTTTQAEVKADEPNHEP